ncbi:MFS transporter [Nocardia rhamnosiphila]
MTRIGLTWGFITVLTGFVQNETQLVITRVLLGMAEAGLGPAVVLFAVRLYRRRHRARATAAVLIGSQVAGAIAGPIRGAILDNVDWLELESWRWVFVLTAVPAVWLSVACYMFVIDRREQASWQTAEQQKWLIYEMATEPTGLSIGDIGAFEVNEAFAPVPLAWLVETGADEAALNPLGGAIALGHPLGASGARLMTTLVHHLRSNCIRYGLQTVREAGGQANATVIESLT